MNHELDAQFPKSHGFLTVYTAVIIRDHVEAPMTGTCIQKKWKNKKQGLECDTKSHLQVIQPFPSVCREEKGQTVPKVVTPMVNMVGADSRHYQ